MQYRNPTLKEYLEIAKLSHVAYRSNWSDGRTDEEVLRDLEEEHGDNLENYLSLHYMAFTDNNDLMAKVSINPFEAYLFGHPVKLGGIGGVATYAEYRQGGHVRLLMMQALQRLYRDGYSLSYLWPFKHSFYRKFGYESHPNFVLYRLDLNEFKLRRQAPAGRWTMLTGEEDLNWPEVTGLYDAFAKETNCMLKRDESRWERYKKANPYHGKQFTYLFHDETNTAAAAFHYSVEGDRREKFNIVDLSFTSASGLEAILDFARRFRNDFDELILPLPVNYPLTMLVDSIPSEDHRMAMLRIVNVAACLELLPSALVRDKSSLILNVTDEQLVENNGSFLCSFDPEVKQTTVTRIEKPEQADAELTIDIKELSLLIAGVLSFDELRLLPQIEYKGDSQLLSLLFVKRFNMHNDYY